MDCCKETQYNIFINLDSNQKKNALFLIELKNNLKLALNWSEIQSQSAVEWAVNNQTFLISKDKLENITLLSQKLALHSIPHSVKLSK